MNKKAIFEVDNYKDTSSFFDEHLYIFAYEGEIRKIILDYKFNGKSYIYETFVNFLKNNPEMCLNLEKYDIIMPVPISRKRMKTRGYNQSNLFAKKLAQQLKVRYIENVLIKIKDNAPQSTLDQKMRGVNVKGVYKVNNNEKLLNKKILLIDDIFTTGSTLNECSRILKNNGAKNIGVFTIAKD